MRQVEAEVKRLEEELARKHEDELKALVRRLQAAKGESGGSSKAVTFVPPPGGGHEKEQRGGGEEGDRRPLPGCGSRPGWGMSAQR